MKSGHQQCARIAFSLDSTGRRLTISGLLPQPYIQHQLGRIPPCSITAAAITQPPVMAHRIRTRLLPMYRIALERAEGVVADWNARRTADAVMSRAIADRLPGAQIRELAGHNIAVSVWADRERPGITVDITPTALRVHVTASTADLDLINTIVDAVAAARTA